MTEIFLEPVPESIGPYSIVRILGEGGMGTVYLAQQHEPLERQVALKVIKLGMDSRAVLRRFEAERSALARMSHENVARVFDAGSTEQGQPYFVMEFVAGRPLTEYCNEEALTLEERVELFLQVCAGVQHAHLKGIVHRDLKPTNVMVAEQEGRAVPKIIDFGLARATDASELQGSMITEQGQILGTPEYMAPEQAGFEGEDIDARTDVYALGVLLYELLVGKLPATRDELLSSGILEALRRIREEDSPRPTTRLRSLGDDAEEVAAQRHTSVVQHARTLRGDLEWIVLEALEKDPERRYQSAAGLAEDLERYLRHEAILARPASRAYALRKFVRRHRAAVAGAAAVAVALSAGLVSYVLENARAQRLGREAIEARGDAEERLQLAIDAMETFFTGVTEDVLLQQEELVDLRTELLRTPIEFFEKLKLSLESGTTSPGDRARLGSALVNLGSLTRAIGSVAEADARYAEAVDLHRELVADEPEREAHRVALLAVLLDHAEVLRQLGRTDDATERVEEVLAELDRSPVADASRWEAEAKEGLAAIEQQVGEFAAAESILLDSIALRRAESEQDPAQREALAEAHFRLAVVYGFSRDLDAAAEQYGAALDLRRELLAEEPDDVALLGATAAAQQGLGRMLTRRGDYEPAIREFRDAIGLRESQVAAQPAVSSYQSELASARQDLGLAFRYAQRLPEARVAYEDAIEAFTVLAERHPAVPRYRSVQARSRQNLGELLGVMNLHEEGIEPCTLAVQGLERLTEEFPQNAEYRRDLSTAANSLATIFQGLGRLEDAGREYQRTADALAALLAANPDSTMFRSRLCATQYNVAQLREQTAGAEAALPLYDAALETAWPEGADEPQDRLTRIILVRAHLGRADLFSQLGRDGEAIEDYDRALAFVASDAERLEVDLLRLISVARLGDPASAVEQLDRTLAGAPPILGSPRLYAAMVLAQAHAADPDAGYAERAVEQVERTRLEAGFDNPHRRRDLREHSALDPLRELPAFQEILASFE